MALQHRGLILVVSESLSYTWGRGPARAVKSKQQRKTKQPYSKIIDLWSKNPTLKLPIKQVEILIPLSTELEDKWLLQRPSHDTNSAWESILKYFYCFLKLLMVLT